jgi:hypothetical protein
MCAGAGTSLKPTLAQVAREQCSDQGGEDRLGLIKAAAMEVIRLLAVDYLHVQCRCRYRYRPKMPGVHKTQPHKFSFDQNKNSVKTKMGWIVCTLFIQDTDTHIF